VAKTVLIMESPARVAFFTPFVAKPRVTESALAPILLNVDPPKEYLGELAALASLAVLVKLSVSVIIIFPAVAALDEVTIARITTESCALPKLTNWCVSTAVAESPKTIESVAASIVNVCAATVAWDGKTESIPNPKEVIAAIAIRLKKICRVTGILSIHSCYWSSVKRR
jgi:hypothetical protein